MTLSSVATVLALHLLHDLIIFKIPFQKVRLDWEKNIIYKIFLSCLITVFGSFDFIFLSAIFESLFLGKPFYLFSQGWMSLAVIILMVACFTQTIKGLSAYYGSYKARMAELNQPSGN